MEIIKVNNLTKVFKSSKKREGLVGGLKDLFNREYMTTTAVDHINISINEGELIGYIGPNGAGKSTSIKMLTGILVPTSGEINVLGYHPFKDRKKYTKEIGVVFGQRTQLWWDLAVRESFNLLSKIYDVKNYSSQLEILINILDIERLLSTPVRKLSLGERMRCELAASLIHNPKILFLDEPTIGLDAVGKEAVRKFLKKINQEFKTTILLTTHDLAEIEELCKRIIIIDKGKVIYDGDLSEIKSLNGLKRSFTVDFHDEPPISELIANFNNKVEIKHEGGKKIVGIYDPQEINTVELIKDLVSRYQIVDISLLEASIDDVIIRIYKDGLN